MNFTGFADVKEIVKWAAKQKAKCAIGQLRLGVVLHALWIIWRCRCNLVFQQEITTLLDSIAMLRKSICASGFLHTGVIRNNQREVILCIFFNVKVKVKSIVSVRKVRCYKPNPGWIKVNVDGATLGQPGIAACG